MKHQLRLLLVCGLALIFSGVLVGGCGLFKIRNDKPSRQQQRIQRREAARVQYEAWQKRPGCTNILEEFRELRRVYSSNQMTMNASMKLARCGHWPYIFSVLTRTSATTSAQMLSRLESVNIGLHRQFDKWMYAMTKPFGYTRSTRHIGWIKRWMSKQGTNPRRHCKTYYDAARRVTKLHRTRRATIKRHMIGYLYMANCRQYKGYIVQLLGDSQWRARSQSCWILKDWGNRSNLRRINILAYSDHYRTSDRRGFPTWPVRKACRAASNAIRLR